MADAQPTPEPSPIEQLLAGIKGKIREEAAKGARDEVRPWVLAALALAGLALWRTRKRGR